MSENQVDALLNGAVDLHYHSGPSPFPRRMDVVDAAKLYDQVGFAAAVMKSHHHTTVFEVLALQPIALDQLSIRVFGGIALNGPVGGLNPRAVDVSLRMGGKVVWFPTMSTRAHLVYHQVHTDSPFPKASVPLMEEAQISVLDEDGKLRSEVGEILEIIRDTGAILSFGHMGIDEVVPVLKLAQSMGIDRMILSHPDFVQQISVDDAKTLAAEGVFIEHCLGMYNDLSPRHDVWPIERLVHWIKEVGPEHTILGSDVGQKSNPSGLDTYRRVVELLLGAGMKENDLLAVLGIHGRALLGIEQ
jgi:hypothetical protein